MNLKNNGFPHCTDEATTKLTSVVHGIIAGVPVKFPLGNPDACSGCNVTCPVQKGKHYNYAPVIHVLDSYPSVSSSMFYEVWMHSDWQVTDHPHEDAVPAYGQPYEVAPLTWGEDVTWNYASAKLVFLLMFFVLFKLLPKSFKLILVTLILSCLQLQGTVVKQQEEKVCVCINCLLCLNFKNNIFNCICFPDPINCEVGTPRWQLERSHLRRDGSCNHKLNCNSSINKCILITLLLSLDSIEEAVHLTLQ